MRETPPQRHREPGPERGLGEHPESLETLHLMTEAERRRFWRREELAAGFDHRDEYDPAPTNGGRE